VEEDDASRGSVADKTHRPRPLFELDEAKGVTQLVGRIGEVGEEEIEEAGDNDGLVAVLLASASVGPWRSQAHPQKGEVDGLLPEEVREPGHDGVDEDHEEDADDVSLLRGLLGVSASVLAG
jgi:hypothetical protein